MLQALTLCEFRQRLRGRLTVNRAGGVPMRIALSLVVSSSLVVFAACSDGTSDGDGPDPVNNTGKGGTSNTTGGTGNTTAGTGNTTAGTGNTTGGTGNTTGGTGNTSAFTCAGTQLTAPEI